MRKPTPVMIAEHDEGEVVDGEGEADLTKPVTWIHGAADWP